MSLLQATDISKRFGATVALDGASLAVCGGEIHGLVGENGSGKSTLMRVLAGVLRADGGRMSLNSVEYAPGSPIEARLAGIAMVHQELALCPHLSVAENIVLGFEPVRGGLLDWREIRRISTEILGRFGYDHLDLDAPLGSLPVAARQIVEICRSLAAGCEFILFDEPTSSLGASDVQQLFAALRTLRSEGVGVLYVSHFLDEISEICDRVTVLRDGRVTGDGDPESLGTSEIVRMMVGREIEDLYVRSDRRPGEVLLSAEDLRGARLPTSASLEVRRGEVLGIAGLNGAGRTEFIRALFGLDPIRSGRIRVGRYLGWSPPRDRWEQGVGLVSEDRKEEGLAINLTISENITLPRVNRFSRWGWLSGARRKAAAERWVADLGIRCASTEQSVSELSGGNQQKVAIARLLDLDADLLLLDEPTRGIDVASKRLVYEIIDRAATGGKAVVMVSSYLPELLGVCDRIAVMCRGRLGVPRDARSASEHDLMEEAVGA